MTPLEMLDGKVGLLENQCRTLSQTNKIMSNRIIELEEQVINVAEKYASTRKYDRELIRREVKNYLIKLQNKK